jgi:hypothetical protein
MSSLGTLCKEDYLAATHATNRSKLVIMVFAGEYESEVAAVHLLMGDYSTADVPYEVFSPSAKGPKPNFNDVHPADHGQTICLGEYEVAVDTVLADPRCTKHAPYRKPG